MYYSKFVIRNFKGIKNIIIDLDKEPKSKVFTLVGLNESGKTSILEAINFFQENLPVSDRHKLIPKNEKIDFNDTVSVSALMKLNSSDNEKLAKYVLKLGYKKIDLVETISISKQYSYTNSDFKEMATNWTINLSGIKQKGTKNREIVYSRAVDSDWQLIVAFIKKELLPTILYYPNFLFDFPDKIFLSESDTDTKEQKTYRGVLQDILYSISEKLNIETHILKRLEVKNNSNKEALEQTLAKMSSIVSGTVFKAWAKLFNISGKEIVIKAGSEIKNDIENYFLQFKLKEGSSQYDITERSLGFKWFFSFLLFTEFRKNRVTENGEILFLLDEPASNLHSTAQKNLLHTFKEIVGKARLIYTTHSHHLINPDWLNGAYIVRNTGINYNDDFSFEANKTDIEAIPYKQFVAKYPDQRDYYQPILDTINFQPGLLEKIPSIIITEGKNDYYTFKYFNNVYFDEKYNELNFYPGGGANSNFMTIRLYMAWNRKFHILLDSDSAGEKAKKLYLKEFGEEIDGSIETFAHINEGYKGKAMEDLFTLNDKVQITKYFDNTAIGYDKGKFNSGLQNLFIESKKIRLDKETISNFKLIFEYFLKK